MSREISRERRSKSSSHSSSPSSKEDKEDARKLRKDLEKKYGYGYTEPILLGLLGIGMVWNIEHQVHKAEEKDKQREREREDREKLYRRRREEQIRAGTWDPQREHAARDRRSEWGGSGSERDRHTRPRNDGGHYRDDYHPRRGSRDEGYQGGDDHRGGGPRGCPDYRAPEYKGRRDQYRDFHDYRYEDRREGR